MSIDLSLIYIDVIVFYLGVWGFTFAFNLVLAQAADISVLASWYGEHGDSDSPVVIIIDDMERCCRSTLSDLILMLRYVVLTFYLTCESVLFSESVDR